MAKLGVQGMNDTALIQLQSAQEAAGMLREKSAKFGPEKVLLQEEPAKIAENNISALRKFWTALLEKIGIGASRPSPLPVPTVVITDAAPTSLPIVTPAADHPTPSPGKASGFENVVVNTSDVSA